MRAGRPCCFRSSRSFAAAKPPLINIQDGTFYRRHPSPSSQSDSSNKPLFPHLTFTLHADAAAKQHVAVVGPSNAGKTTFLQLLQGQHISFPPNARSYPYLSSPELLAKDHRLSHPSRAIKYVGFDEKQKGLSGMGSYLSARFESRKEQTDFKLIHYLKGRTQLNTSDEFLEPIDNERLAEVVADLRLDNLLHMPVINLSNGQTRRARIAKALMSRPELLLLDEPFMGLDPPTTVEFNPLLRRLAYAASPRIVLALRPQDPIPSWITDIIYLERPLEIAARGDRGSVTRAIDEQVFQMSDSVDLQVSAGINEPSVHDLPVRLPEFGRLLLDDGIVQNPFRLANQNRYPMLTALVKYEAGDRKAATMKAVFSPSQRPLDQTRREGRQLDLPPQPPIGDVLLEMNGVTIKYGDKPALGDWQEQLRMESLPDGQQCLVREPDSSGIPGLRLTVRRGQRWAIIGPNGSGKTTLLSLITSDHPQAYSAPMRLFGRSRLPSAGSPGLSLFEIQSRIGQSSPEVHSFFPKTLSVRRTLESAWADTFLGRPNLTDDAERRVDACLRWFQQELNPAAGPDPELQQEITTLTLGYGADETFKFKPSNPTRPKLLEREKEEYFFRYGERLRDLTEWADHMCFGDMTFSGQRVALFLRAIIAQPDIVILDEALSGMDERMRDKCLTFLEHGESRVYTPFNMHDRTLAARSSPVMRRRLGIDRERKLALSTGITDEQALIVVSHVPQEVPRAVRDWIFLPAAGSDQRAFSGHVGETALCDDVKTWSAVWGASRLPVKSRREYEREAGQQRTVRASAKLAEELADASIAEISDLTLTAERVLAVGRVDVFKARFHMGRMMRLQTGQPRKSRAYQRLGQFDAVWNRLSSARRKSWEARTRLLYRKDVSQLPEFVNEMGRKLHTHRNWTTFLKMQVSEVRKQLGFVGYQRYVKQFQLPRTLEEAEAEWMRQRNGFYFVRTLVKDSIQRMQGTEAADAFDDRFRQRVNPKRRRQGMSEVQIMTNRTKYVYRRVCVFHQEALHLWAALFQGSVPRKVLTKTVTMKAFLLQVLGPTEERH